jgi:matrix metalloproteinase-25 (membrane-inserted)
LPTSRDPRQTTKPPWKITQVPRTRTTQYKATHPYSPDTTSLPIPEKCETDYDAIVKIRNEHFIFKGRYMWRPDKNSSVIEIRNMWKELPDSLTCVDAVYESDDSRIWFFIGQEIYIFTGRILEQKLLLAQLGIHRQFSKIDFIFKWHFNKKSYIFSGDHYWRLNGSKVDAEYPKLIGTKWRNVFGVDTAFSDENNLYFLKGLLSYQFNSRLMQLDRSNPQQNSQKFMNCPKLLPSIERNNGANDNFVDWFLLCTMSLSFVFSRAVLA